MAFSFHLSVWIFEMRQEPRIPYINSHICSDYIQIHYASGIWEHSFRAAINEIRPNVMLRCLSQILTFLLLFRRIERIDMKFLSLWHRKEKQNILVTFAANHSDSVVTGFLENDRNDRWFCANGVASDSRQVHVVCEAPGNKDHVITQPPSNCWLR